MLGTNSSALSLRKDRVLILLGSVPLDLQAGRITRGVAARGIVNNTLFPRAAERQHEQIDQAWKRPQASRPVNITSYVGMTCCIRAKTP